MEGLWSLLVLLGVVASVIQKFKKGQPQKGQKSASSPQRAGSSGSAGNAGSPWRQMLPPDPFDPTSWGTFFEQARQQAAPAPVADPPAPPPPPSREYSPGLEGRSLEWGSLSTEGMDTCDPSLGHSRPSVQMEEYVAAEPIPVSAFSLSFTPDALAQGIIMNEILTRPSQRKRGWR